MEQVPCVFACHEILPIISIELTVSMLTTSGYSLTTQICLELNTYVPLVQANHRYGLTKQYMSSRSFVATSVQLEDTK